MKKEELYHIERVYFSEKSLSEIMSMQQYMPSFLRVSANRARANLLDRRNINMFMRDHDGEVACYIFACPQDEIIVNDFVGEEHCLVVDDDRYYIDQVVARGDMRRGVDFSKLLFAVFSEANNMGFFHFSAHALCSNGFDRIISFVLRKYLTCKKPVTLKRYGNEKYVYMEADYDQKKICSTMKVD